MTQHFEEKQKEGSDIKGRKWDMEIQWPRNDGGGNLDKNPADAAPAAAAK